MELVDGEMGLEGAKNICKNILTIERKWKYLKK
jgi:hypothetical protein